MSTVRRGRRPRRPAKERYAHPLRNKHCHLIRLSAPSPQGEGILVALTRRLPPWVGKLREAVMRGIARRSRISFRQEYRVRKDISCRQAYRLREAQQKRYSVDAERYACLRKHDMFAFANTICGVMPAQIENHPIENSSSDTYLDSLFHE